MRETLKEQKQYKKSITVYLEPQIVQILKYDAKKKHGMLFSRYLEKVLTDRANRVKGNKDDLETI